VVRSKAAPAPEAKGSPKAKRAKGNPRRIIMEHPIVLQALEILGGDLVDIRMVKSDRMVTIKGETPSEPEEGPEFI
jgi:hypothetical protein